MNCKLCGSTGQMFVVRNRAVIVGNTVRFDGFYKPETCPSKKCAMWREFKEWEKMHRAREIEK